MIVCTYMGTTTYHLGDTLYIGLSKSLRLGIAYAFTAPGKSAHHSVQEPLMEFQNAGGLAHLMYCPLESEDHLAPLKPCCFRDLRNVQESRLPETKRGAGTPDHEEVAALVSDVQDRLGV